jgi:hypothetical protein
MQLFTRSVSLVGPLADVTGFAMGMRDHVSNKLGREVALWNVLFGAPVGTMVYSARVDGIADMQTIGQTLIADPEYHERLATGRALSAGPPADSLATPIYGELGDAPPPVGSVAVVTTAAIANGKYAEAIKWGIEIAQLVEGVSGAATMFLMQDYGAFGHVTWIGVTPDAASADAAGQKVNADPGYLDKLSAVGELFAEGSGHRALLARVG